LQDGVTERDIGSGFYCLLFVPTNARIYIYIYIYIKRLNYIRSAATYFGASAPSNGNFDIAVAKVINIKIT